MKFSVRQLQDKCNEHNMPLFIAVIDLTKAFDLVSREGLFAILLKIGCPLNLFNIVKSYHTNKGQPSNMMVVFLIKLKPKVG